MNIVLLVKIVVSNFQASLFCYGNFINSCTFLYSVYGLLFILQWYWNIRNMCPTYFINLLALRAEPQNPQNLDLFWSRSHLYEELGEKKKALEGYKSMLRITPSQDGERYMEIARTITKVTNSQ